ncbi:MAG: hypothetical protein LBS89_05665 [Zoogloeaceae bacterium]|nr:hypothetical protein [Zoogloeaceae bacterium]
MQVFRLFRAFFILAFCMATGVLTTPAQAEDIITPNPALWSKIAATLQADFECRDRPAGEEFVNVLTVLKIRIPEDEFFSITLRPPQNFRLFGLQPEILKIHVGTEGDSTEAFFLLPLPQLTQAARLKKTSDGEYGREEIKRVGGAFWLSAREETPGKVSLECTVKNWVE